MKLRIVEIDAHGIGLYWQLQKEEHDQRDGAYWTNKGPKHETLEDAQEARDGMMHGQIISQRVVE